MIRMIKKLQEITKELTELAEQFNKLLWTLLTTAGMLGFLIYQITQWFE